MKHFHRIFIVMLLIIAFLMGACSVGTVKAEQNRPIKIWYQNENGYVHTWVVVDDTTGVNYIAVTTERGNGEMTIAITPRLNADGSLYTD